LGKLVEQARRDFEVAEGELRFRWHDVVHTDWEQVKKKVKTGRSDSLDALERYWQKLLLHRVLIECPEGVQSLLKLPPIDTPVSGLDEHERWRRGWYCRLMWGLVYFLADRPRHHQPANERWDNVLKFVDEMSKSWNDHRDILKRSRSRFRGLRWQILTPEEANERHSKSHGNIEIPIETNPLGEFLQRKVCDADAHQQVRLSADEWATSAGLMWEHINADGDTWCDVGLVEPKNGKQLDWVREAIKKANPSREEVVVKLVWTDICKDNKMQAPLTLNHFVKVDNRFWQPAVQGPSTRSRRSSSSRRHTPSRALHGTELVAVKELKPSGLHWLCVGSRRPESGSPLKRCNELGKALSELEEGRRNKAEHGLQFDDQEWAKFDISDLCWESFVEVKIERKVLYFIPVSADRLGRLKSRLVQKHQESSSDRFLTFTPDEWKTFEPLNLQKDNYIRIGGTFFRPAQAFGLGGEISDSTHWYKHYIIVPPRVSVESGEAYPGHCFKPQRSSHTEIEADRHEIEDEFPPLRVHVCANDTLSMRAESGRSMRVCQCWLTFVVGTEDLKSPDGRWIEGKVFQPVPSTKEMPQSKVRSYYWPQEREGDHAKTD